MLRLPESFFLTGTDTGVGKTYLAAEVVKARRRQGYDCIGMKPICCGDRGDAEQLFVAAEGSVEINEINPLWFRTPAAPFVAAMVESRPMDVSLVLEVFSALRGRHRQLIVEGVGGWRVPITRDFAVNDLAREMRLPVVVVIANRLGALNHARLTVEAIAASGLECAGVILNHPIVPEADDDIAVTTNEAALQEILQVPVLGTVNHGAPPDLAR